MTENVGSIDRALRAIVGLVLIGLPFLTNFAIWQNPLAFLGALVVGVVLLGTALFGFCPAYRVFGVKTKKV